MQSSQDNLTRQIAKVRKSKTKLSKEQESSLNNYELKAARALNESIKAFDEALKFNPTFLTGAL